MVPFDSAQGRRRGSPQVFKELKKIDDLQAEIDAVHEGRGNDPHDISLDY